MNELATMAATLGALLKERKETTFIATDWGRPNRDGETDPTAVRLWVNPVEVPGVLWNASQSQKK